MERLHGESFTLLQHKENLPEIPVSIVLEGVEHEDSHAAGTEDSHGTEEATSSRGEWGGESGVHFLHSGRGDHPPLTPEQEEKMTKASQRKTYRGMHFASKGIKKSGRRRERVDFSVFRSDREQFGTLPILFQERRQCPMRKKALYSFLEQDLR